MKKGTTIRKVVIDIDGQVTVYDNTGGLVKLSRSQRNLMKRYRDPDYLDNIRKDFGNANVLSDEFEVEKNGVIVFTL